MLSKFISRINKNSIIRVGDKISSKLKVQFSGQVIFKSPFKIDLHKSTPFFVTQNTRVIKKSGDLIEQSEFLGTIVIVSIIIFGGSLVLSEESSMSGAVFITYIIIFSQIFEGNIIDQIKKIIDQIKNNPNNTSPIKYKEIENLE